jgi:hypothetical protein
MHARPQTPPPRTLRGDLSRLAKPAGAVASGIVSLAVREFLRRRRRR